VSGVTAKARETRESVTATREIRIKRIGGRRMETSLEHSLSIHPHSKVFR
jgi:hypothetical protein